MTNPDLAIDRCWALLAAGLAAEAARETSAALDRIPPGGGISYKTAELLFAAATAALACGHPADARQRARQARRLFRAQRRSPWEARASLVLAEARYAAGEHSPALLRYAEEVAARLEASHADEAMQAHLLAGRIALTRGSVTQADPHLERAARSRRRGPPLPRSVAWLARALQAEARGNARATVAACARGLDALQEHQMRLGATELRAYGTAHGAELATLAQRDALRRGDVRRLLFWSERWRATALAARSASPDRGQGTGGRARGPAQREPAPQGTPRWPPRAGTPWNVSGGGSRRRSRPARAGCPAARGPAKGSSTWTSFSPNSARPR